MQNPFLPWYAFAALLGIVGGAGSFYYLFDEPQVPTWEFDMRHSQISGRVESVDLANRTVTIIAAKHFPPELPARMRFSLDDETVWSSDEYVFEGDTLVRTEIKREEPRTLPEGTLIAIRFDPTRAGPLVARNVTFIRRSSI